MNKSNFSRSTRRPSLHDSELSTSQRSKFTLSQSCCLNFNVPILLHLLSFANDTSGIAVALVKRRSSQSRFSNSNLLQTFHRALLTLLGQSHFQLHTRSCQCNTFESPLNQELHLWNNLHCLLNRLDCWNLASYHRHSDLRTNYKQFGLIAALCPAHLFVHSNQTIRAECKLNRKPTCKSCTLNQRFSLHDLNYEKRRLSLFHGKLNALLWEQLHRSPHWLE